MYIRSSDDDQDLTLHSYRLANPDALLPPSFHVSWCLGTVAYNTVQERKWRPVNRPAEGAPGQMPWAGPDSVVSHVVLEQSERCLRSYEVNPTLIEEHANIERSTTQGGYGHRQLYELVQNGADELQQEPGGGITVILARDALYCANLGTPITPEGAETILGSHLSRKRGTEIGRFGLGFKSVLSVSDTPQVFSRTGSFGWDATQARRLIRERHPSDGPTPVLRVARLLDPLAEQDGDPVLVELMEWATTVVKLPLAGDHSERLARDLRDFPAKFAIFSPHVGEVILEDRRNLGTTLRREIYVRAEGDQRALFTDDGLSTETSEWMVFERIHIPTEGAKREAGEYHDRDRVPLAWAVPTKGQAGPGEFWAFFPTTYTTTLRGVLNAPWKTNEDRQNLLKGNAFNQELMQVAAELIVESLPRLATPDDPSRHLSLITARGREARNWADEMLTDLVYDMAGRRPSLPDQRGVLRPPNRIRLHPERLDKTWLNRWASYPRRPLDWCHYSVEDTTRRSRAEIILDRVERGPASVREWLEALVSDGSAKASAVALAIVADMVHQRHEYADQARSARVLRTEDGTMVPPLADTVFRRTNLDHGPSDLPFVEPELRDDPAAGWALGVLGIREADPLGRLAAAVRRGFHGYQDDDWEHFWGLARATGAGPAAQNLTEQRVESSRLRVRTVAGEFRPLGECLLPGEVIPPKSDDDAEAVVDIDFHQPDLGMLGELGMTDRPRIAVDPSGEPWYSDYRDVAIRHYYDKLPASASRPQEHNIVVEGPQPAGPLGFLPRLSPAARARFINAIPSAGLETTWRVYSRTRQKPRLNIQSPLVWMVRRHGIVPTSRGLRPIEQCVGIGLAEHRRLLPIIDVDSALANLLRLPQDIEGIPETLWSTLLDETCNSEDDAEIGAFYALAEVALEAPPQIRCRRGDGWQVLPPADVAVTADRGQFHQLITHDVPTVLAPDVEATKRLVTGWGLKPHSEALVAELRAVPTGEPTPVEDLFPQLRLLPNRPLRGLSLIRCNELEELIKTSAGQVARPLVIGLDENVVYYQGGDDDLDLLRELSGLLGIGFSTERCQQVLRHRDEQRKSKRVVEVRRQKDDTDRLIAMLPPSVIREKLPQGLVEHIEHEEGEVDDRTIAELAISVHGSGLLREYRPELEEAGFTLPSQLAGGHRARAFVSDLGFSSEFAGFSKPPLDPTVTVEGPVNFPPLHNYQERMVERVAEVLRSKPAQRGMLSLPTGAGKTRIAVEAIIRTLRTLLSPDQSSLPVLWIAQTEELCEQAVQTWQFVWRATGPTERLTISRLWSSNEADPVTHGFHLVIATDAKLEKAISTDGYGWLRDAQAVIVDEAHTSTTSRYTQVLTAVGLTPHRTRCPLVGLSATPFRGISEVETDRLASRYARNRLDHDRDGLPILGDNAHLTLQDLGVLARVQNKELRGADVELDQAEQEDLERMRRLPASVEERLARDNGRNAMLIEQIADLHQDWPVLFFASSVNHARTMAALLTRNGIRAAPVSGDMDRGVRRRTIEAFRNHKIRVLTNYGVLSQGFDAPSTRAVVVARPTYSPNVYLQMIGRGLRGPKNGGKEECLIINVADNIAQYGEDLAFRQFEYLWARQ